MTSSKTYCGSSAVVNEVFKDLFADCTTVVNDVFNDLFAVSNAAVFERCLQRPIAAAMRDQ